MGKTIDKTVFRNVLLFVLAAIAIIFMLVVLAGCSAATVTEFYERTPQRAISIGEGLTEASGKQVMLNEPFRMDAGEEKECE